MKSQKPIAVVTGANSDLGLPLTHRLIELGFLTVAHYHKNPSRLTNIDSPNLRVTQADLTDPNGAEQLVQVASEFGNGISLLCNIVGPFDHRFIFDFTPEEWSHSIQLNLNTAFNMVHFARPHLLRAKGQIINFTYAGVENMKAQPEATAYAAAKAGVAILTKSLASAFADTGVRVNAIAPGWIDHPDFTEAKRREIAATIPVRKLGTPDDVVKIAHWLVTEAPAYTTGSTLTVGGAWEL